VTLLSENPEVTLMYLAGLAGSFVVLSLLAYGLLRTIRLLPKPRHILLRHAVTSLTRPGAQSFSIILALGLGLSLFVTLALTDHTISNELRSGIPEQAPAFFFLDVRNDELPQFRSALEKETGVSGIRNAPMLRGRITEVKGVSADKVVPKPGVGWALQGDRGLTYSATLPQGSELAQGQWWASDYKGKPLVSVEQEIAEGLDLRIGDSIKVNVLGREIEAEVANLRRVNWRSMGLHAQHTCGRSPCPYRDGGNERRRRGGLAQPHGRAISIGHSCARQGRTGNSWRLARTNAGGCAWCQWPHSPHWHSGAGRRHGIWPRHPFL
jgi:putative ABC transport system permease protein